MARTTYLSYLNTQLLYLFAHVKMSKDTPFVYLLYQFKAGL